MRRTLLNSYIQEILSFADDEDDCAVVSNTVTFQRLNQMVEVQIIEKDNAVFVNYNGNIMPYRTFMAKELARLDLMASKIVQKFKDDSIYIDPYATLFDVKSKNQSGNAEKLLEKECNDHNNFDTKICFVTADAGHGKTVLLKHMQYENAKKYLNHDSEYIFWHIDLHGRDLLRLNEAMMYEIGVLRLSGLYYNSIITLIRNGLIVLAIDGFDELAAEIGGEKVLGSLTNLVNELDGQGTLIAASRRTFFNTQDYLKRSKLLQNSIDQSCEFDELRISNWREDECVQYLSYYYDLQTSREEYHKISSALRDTDGHPIIERPFLFTKLVNYAINGDPQMKPSEFLQLGGDKFDSINKIIEAFVEREVHKWNYFDKQTGKPYLTFGQHIEFLTEIAQEMWRTQKDYISVEIIQYLTTILMESWNIESQMKPQIIRVAESHAFMVISENGDNFRRFDHEEFQYYFIACYLKSILLEASCTNNYEKVKSFLYIGLMQESVTRYLMKMIPFDKAPIIIDGLLEMKSNEWKTTYLQPNLGMLLPYLLSEVNNSDTVMISDGVTFTSLVFENKTINNVTFKDCSFINISFNNTILCNVNFINCTFTDIKINTYSNNKFVNVIIDVNSTINKVTKASDDENNCYSEYSPYNIDEFLKREGIKRSEENNNKMIINKNSEFRKIVRRFINKFLKSTHQYEINFTDDQEYYSMPQKVLMDEVIPLMEKYEIIQKVNNKNTNMRSSKAWALKDYEISEIYKAEEDVNSKIHQFWIEVNKHV